MPDPVRANHPLVTIVVPSYQQARFLSAAIDSVLAQDYEPVEVLVFDGGSTDGSVEILERYGDRIWFCSEPDGGQCDAINRGFAKARGEIVAWLNSDDFYYPGAIRCAVDALSASPSLGLVYGEGNLVDEHGDVLRRFPETVPFDLWRLANVSDYILQPTVFFRRSALAAAGAVREGLGPLDEQYNWGLDWDLWLRLGQRLPFGYVSDVLAAGRIYTDTKTATGGFKRLRELLRILRRHGVRGPSPAAVAHTITTTVRKVKPSQDAVVTDELVGGMPKPLRAVGRPVVGGAERRLRRWLQNAQGYWPDGYVGAVGHLWLPNDGSAARLRVRGRNLCRQEQAVTLKVGKRRVRSHYLAPEEPFELELPVDEGMVPVRVCLSCTRTVAIDPLDPDLGPRRAGVRIEAPELLGVDERLGAERESAAVRSKEPEPGAAAR